jgi:DNA-binding YbaB/EbfC family protein
MQNMNIKDMAGMLKQVQQIGQKMEEVQRELAKLRVVGEAGGGMVKVTANGKHEILKIEIEKDLLNPDDQDMLCDLIVAATNKALQESSRVAQEEMMKVTGGMMTNMDFLKDLNMGGGPA